MAHGLMFSENIINVTKETLIRTERKIEKSRLITSFSAFTFIVFYFTLKLNSCWYVSQYDCKILINNNLNFVKSQKNLISTLKPKNKHEIGIKKKKNLIPLFVLLFTVKSKPSCNQIIIKWMNLFYGKLYFISFQPNSLNNQISQN